MAAAEFRMPTNKQRIMCVGKTGSGKTMFGAWALSKAPFDLQPYVIIDYKGDDFLASIEGAREIGYNDKPKHPGLYYFRAEAERHAEMDNWLRGVWSRGKTGLFFDEGYMVAGNAPGTYHFTALANILTQGRSLRIPVIMLSQRPAWLSRFSFSEADFFALFYLNDERDEKTVRNFTPRDYDRHPAWAPGRLPDYHARWYDVGQDFSAIVSPVPTGDAILEAFEDKLRTLKKRRVI